MLLALAVAVAVAVAVVVVVARMITHAQTGSQGHCLKKTRRLVTVTNSPGSHGVWGIAR